jgi:tRNA 2-thiouridine synthesizing protein A
MHKTTILTLAVIAAVLLLVMGVADPLAAIDIPAFCSEAGHRLVETTAGEHGHRFLVERGRIVSALAPKA